MPRAINAPVPGQDGIIDFTLLMVTANDYYPFGMQMPGKNYNAPNAKDYRYGFHNYEKDDEVKGEGNHYTFSDFGYDPRISRRWRVDPKEAKFPFISPYAAFNDNPIIYVDPDGRENIVVVGGADIKQNDRYKFINSGLGQAFRYGSKEKTTIVLVTNNMTAEEIKQVQQSVAAGNINVFQGRQVVNLVLVQSADEVANYFNSQNKNSNEVSPNRLKDKITDVAVFGHGIPGSMEFGYDYKDGPKSEEEQKTSFGANQINKLDPQAFDNADICLSTCNSATTDKEGGNVAKDISKQTKSKVSGYKGLSTYIGIYSALDKVLKAIGYKILPATNDPKEYKSAEKKVYKNGDEQ